MAAVGSSTPKRCVTWVHGVVMPRGILPAPMAAVSAAEFLCLE